MRDEAVIEWRLSLIQTKDEAADGSRGQYRVMTFQMLGLTLRCVIVLL
jgi:hypothetical protein